MANTVHFQLDQSNTICETDAAWDDFATSNAAATMVGETVIGHRVFDHVADSTTRMLYERVYERVRAGNSVSMLVRARPGRRGIILGYRNPSS